MELQARIPGGEATGAGGHETDRRRQNGATLATSPSPGRLRDVPRHTRSATCRDAFD